MQRRVVITGTGLVTPVGGDVASSWQSLVDGKSGVRHVDEWAQKNWSGKSLPVQIAGLVKNDFAPKR